MQDSKKKLKNQLNLEVIEKLTLFLKCLIIVINTNHFCGSFF